MTAISERQRQTRERKAAARILKAEGMARLGVLRAKLKADRAAKKARMKALVETFRDERKALGEHLRAMRASAMREIGDKAKGERLAAKETWRAQKAAAKKSCDTAIELARANLAAERRHQVEQRRIAQDEKVARVVHQTGHAHAHTDEQVRAAIPSPLWPLYLQVKGKLRPATGKTRAEAFLHYAETHPAEAHALLHSREERALAATVAAVTQAANDVAKISARVPNAYELKRAAKLERQQEKAARLKAAAEAAVARGRTIGSGIPMGQPILVGHHSERRHRRDINRMQHAFEQGAALSDKAKRRSGRHREAPREAPPREGPSSPRPSRCPTSEEGSPCSRRSKPGYSARPSSATSPRTSRRRPARRCGPSMPP